jgi:hypothetical protein
MAKLLNKSARVIHLDGNILVPGNETEVSDEVMERNSVKLMLEAGELEVPKPAKTATPPPPAPPAGTSKDK